MSTLVKNAGLFGLKEKQIAWWEKEVRKFRESWCLAELHLECARDALEDTRRRLEAAQEENKRLQSMLTEAGDEYDMLQSAYEESERVRKKLYYENVALRRKVEGRDGSDGSENLAG